MNQTNFTSLDRPTIYQCFKNHLDNSISLTDKIIEKLNEQPTKQSADSIDPKIFNEKNLSVIQSIETRLASTLDYLNKKIDLINVQMIISNSSSKSNQTIKLELMNMKHLIEHEINLMLLNFDKQLNKSKIYDYSIDFVVNKMIEIKLNIKKIIDLINSKSKKSTNQIKNSIITNQTDEANNAIKNEFIHLVSDVKSKDNHFESIQLIETNNQLNESNDNETYSDAICDYEILSQNSNESNSDASIDMVDYELVPSNLDEFAVYSNDFDQVNELLNKMDLIDGDHL